MKENELKHLKTFQTLIEQLGEKKASVVVNGIIKEATPHFTHQLSLAMDRTTLLLLEDELRAKSVYESLQDLGVSEAAYYPSFDFSYHNIKALNAGVENQRIEWMQKLSRNEKLLIVTTFDALKKRISTPKFFGKAALTLTQDIEVDRDEIIQRLVHMQYERVPMVESSGQFAVRGGIIDIYPVTDHAPIRVELFDTEIDTIRRFNVSDQRSMDRLDEVRITPAREFLFSDADRVHIREGLEKDMDRVRNHPSYGVDNEHLLEKFTEIFERLDTEHMPDNLDLLMPYIKGNSYATLLDYLPSDAVILIEDIARCYDRIRQVEKQQHEDFTVKLEQGEVFPSHVNILLDFTEIQKSLKKHSVLNITQLKKNTRLLSPEKTLSIKTVEAQSYNRNISEFTQHMASLQARGYKIRIFAGSAEKAASFKTILEENGAVVTLPKNPNQPILSGQIFAQEQNYPRGFEYPEIKTLLVTHAEIYGSEKRRSKAKPKKKTGSDIIHYSDLVSGDYVVHENHGIGQYRGLEQIEIQGIVKDYLILQYRGADKLYIPIDQMDLIQRYIGEGARGPKLNKLGSSDWVKTKAKAKKALDEIAEDLVELYADRAHVKGFSFSPDTPWQREFEDSFIYEETYAQVRSLQEIKEDMERDKPMERLLCGDVGYGKTEVALRAAFKAIMDGKQVAFLVPTTILAMQHMNTAEERFNGFPIKVEMISRFRTAREQKKILEDTRKGFVDLLIGTHRLLSKDLKFKDVGLLIIDEEQRFGVRHKEKLKEIRKNIDVLMLSATPIPRTLQMGLVGIKDMSVLDEPPEERYPTTTYVIEYEEAIVREAIKKELIRGGQVYFVYNRISDIDRMAQRLSKLVPEADIVTAHGRMSEKTLEDVMIRFTEGDFDVLLSTTIIETGMDIQNVNTMIVYNADRMGLSQLYQLKGRIGRGDRSSFAYFTYEKDKSLSEISEKRLMAIRDFSDFGSGFKIAMRDLELRGAGNMLGESQHGHIEAIGYDLYVKFLEEAIRTAKGESVEEKQEVLIELRVDAFIPSDYIIDSGQKIEIYKRIAELQTESEQEDIIDELIDRYGDIPESVLNVIHIARCKAIASQLKLSRIKETVETIHLEYLDMYLFNAHQIHALDTTVDVALEFHIGSAVSEIVFYKKRHPLSDLLHVLVCLAQIKGVKI